MSRFVRLGRRTTWFMALGPVLALGSCAVYAVLWPPEPVARERQRSTPDERSRRGPAPAGGADLARDVTTPARPGRSRETVFDEPELRRVVLDRASTPGKRASALRSAFQCVDTKAALALALAVLDDAPGGTLECEALRLLGPAAKKSTEFREQCVRSILRALERAADPEVALAGGAALDAIVSLNAVDLARAFDRCALAESRVVLLGGLAPCAGTPEAAAAIERAIRSDPAPLVRQEALALFAATAEDRDLERLHDALASDADLRRFLARALARQAGPAADRILSDAFEAESDPTVARGLARTLANRSDSARSVLVAMAQGRDGRASLAAAVLVETSIGRTTK